MWSSVLLRFEVICDVGVCGYVCVDLIEYFFEYLLFLVDVWYNVKIGCEEFMVWV